MARKFDRLVHLGSIKDGELVFDNPKWFKGMFQLYEDCRVRVLVERYKANATKEQWGYLWGVVYPEAARVTGHSQEELHEIMKSMHLRRKMVWRGHEVTTVRGASDLTMNELAEFITDVVFTLNELGIEIPPPDKLYQFREEL